MNFQIIVNSLISSSIYLLIAISFYIIYSTVRFFHLAHGAVYTVGAYTAYAVVSFWLSVFGSQSGVPLTGYTIAGIAAIISGIISGVLIDRMVYKPLRKRKASDLILLLASFGIFIFIENLIALIFGNQILSLRTGPVKEGYQLSVFGYRLNAVITDTQVWLLVVGLLLSVGVYVFIKYTKTGKAMRAVADDPITANIVGINPERIILISFIIGSGIAGFAGLLIPLETNLEPTMGFNILLKGVIAVIIGGIGSFRGAILGSLFLGFTENFAVWFLPSGWKDAITFGIFLIFLLFRPQGLTGIQKERP